MKARQKNNQEKLYRIADGQVGLFTVQQAMRAGYDSRNHSYYVRKGYWIKECRGVYRLRHYPYSDDSHLVLWALWSRNKKDQPQGVYSHETALNIHGLTDLMPSKLHMTVPIPFRRHSKVPKILILYKAHVTSGDIKQMGGYSVTSAARTISDLIKRGTPEEVLEQAIVLGLKKGIVTRKEYKKILSLEEIDHTSLIKRLKEKLNDKKI
ncbi:MAG: type IV toxin-antitoxin system AbiEi family antitoxin domain-containing protein [Deltaproteobacteria bacterium]|nr:type IV toxin-antitoxin system AbiEi family antitoxin domain-containing protein [Deltaproteobacteria bacterium]